MSKIISHISKSEIDKSNAVKGNSIRKPLFDMINTMYPGFGPNNYLSLSELNTLRRKYLSYLIEQERGELDSHEKNVMEYIRNNKIMTENVEEEIESRLTLAQKMADDIARFGGSWLFISFFFGFLLLWIIVNSIVVFSKPFDPYPFILLNLILSCLAAIQAPIIMMSQNRQEQKDRKRSEHDYQINLKAELEINLLNEKIDHLQIHQNNILMEIQELQADYLDDIIKHISELSGKK